MVDATRGPAPETVPASGVSAGIPRDVTLAKHPHIGRWITAIVIVAFVLWIVVSAATNPNLDWAIVGHYLLNTNILEGLLLTLQLAIIAQVIALIVGLVIAFFRLSTNPVLQTFAIGYLWLFRSTPLLVLILIAGNIALFIPNITIGVPFTDIVFVSGNTNTIIPAFAAAVIALVLHDSAYDSEIIRSGILSVDSGQQEAASALGLTWWQTQRRIVLPQALRVMVPPLANQFVTLLKSTALVSVIGVTDLLTEAQNISANNLRTIELLLVATIWFLIVTSLASIGQRYIERRLGRGNAQQKRKTAVKAEQA